MEFQQILLFILSSNELLRTYLSSPIVGGRAVFTPPGSSPKFPFMVSLQDIFTNGNLSHFCGGSLVNPRWILTAAHCFWEKNIITTVAFIGFEDISSLDPKSDGYKLDRIEFQNFQSTTYKNDIALLHLERSYVSPNYGLTTAKLPKYEMRPNRNRACTVIGYGVVNQLGELSTRLREANVYVITKKSCREKLGHVWAPQKQDNIICVLGDEQDACQGDSGGPLLCSYGGQQYVYGIVSYGIVCGGRDVPSLYTVTVRYVNWIESIVNT